MTTATRQLNAHSLISTEFQFMLDCLDERIQAFEVSDGYYRSLTADEWDALVETAARNGIPLRLV